MEEDVKFPFMILLISGGHCILGIAKVMYCSDRFRTSTEPGDKIQLIKSIIADGWIDRGIEF